MHLKDLQIDNPLIIISIYLEIPETAKYWIRNYKQLPGHQVNKGYPRWEQKQYRKNNLNFSWNL